MAQLYDFKLTEKSNLLVGHPVTDPEDQEPTLLAVGDGNHSPAPDKNCEAVKAGAAGTCHPALLALGEPNKFVPHKAPHRPRSSASR